MPRMPYVGPPPEDSGDVSSRLQGTDILSSGPINRTVVESQIIDAIALRADKSFVDTEDAKYALQSYYQTRDGLNVATATKGQPNGVASLDGSAKIPLAQMPTLGAGYVKGPFGPTSVTTQAGVGTTPVKIADFNIGVQSITFTPLFWASVLINTSLGGQPIIEARISDGQAGSQTMIARGEGRSIWASEQTIAVLPASATNGATGTVVYPPSMNIWVSMWLYSTSTATVGINTSAIASAGVFLMRTAQ